MVFGRKAVHAELEGQRQRLARTEALLARLEQAAARLNGYREQTFSEVWFESADVVDAVVKAGQARQLLEGVKARLATASGPIAGADNNLDLVERVLQVKLVILDSFVAVLVGRQHIWAAGDRAPGETFDPSIRECQQALYASGSQLADIMQQHIDELSAIRERHEGPWPRRLDLANLQIHLDDAREALKIYEQRFASHDEALSQQLPALPSSVRAHHAVRARELLARHVVERGAGVLDNVGAA